MHLHEILRTQLAIAQAKFGPLNILETGTIRGETENYASDDGWSTVCFAEWVKEHGGVVTSVDLDTSAAIAVLERRGLAIDGVFLAHAHSISYLGGRLMGFFGNERPDRDNRHQVQSGPIHLAYLDSDNDPTLILNEYLLVKQLMPSGAIVMVDDVDLSGASGARKGHAIAPWLEKHGQEYTIVSRHGDGYSTGVLITGIP